MTPNNDNARKQSQNGRFDPPRLEDVAAHISEKGYATFSPEQFSYFYQSNVWVISRGRPMKDWRSAVSYRAVRDRAKQTAAPHNTNNKRNYGNHDNHTGPDDLAGGAANEHDRNHVNMRLRDGVRSTHPIADNKGANMPCCPPPPHPRPPRLRLCQKLDLPLSPEHGVSPKDQWHLHRNNLAPPIQSQKIRTFARRQGYHPLLSCCSAPLPSPGIAERQ